MPNSPNTSNSSFNLFDVLAKPEQAPIMHFFISFFVITPALGLAVNGLSAIIFERVAEALKEQFGFSKLFWQLLFVLLSTLLVFVLILVFKIPQLIRDLRDSILNLSKLTVDTVNTNTLTDTFQGLITLASPPPKPDRDGKYRPTPAELAIRHHLQKQSLQHCWIICTHKSLPEAQRIVNQVVNVERLTTHEVFHFQPVYELFNQNRNSEPLSLLVEDRYADDPNHICQLINAIFIDAKARYGLNDDRVITDYTGATKSFTAGVILACVSPNRNLQYISQVDDQMKEIKISYKLRPIKIDSSDTTSPVATSLPY